MQVGFVTWYALMVQGSDWEPMVREVLSRIKFEEVRTIEAAIKIMGVVSDAFKSCYSEFPAVVHTELNSIPWWVFSGADNVYGYLEYDTNDLKDWKEEFFTNFVEWLMIEKPESFGPFPIEYDMILAMETSLCEFRDCYGPMQTMVDFKDRTPLHTAPDQLPIDKEYLFKLNKEFLRKKHLRDHISTMSK